MSKYIGKLTSKETNIKSIITIITRLLNSKPHSEQDSISNKNHPFYPILNNIKPSTDVTPQVVSHTHPFTHIPYYPYPITQKFLYKTTKKGGENIYLGMVSSWKRIRSKEARSINRLDHGKDRR